MNRQLKHPTFVSVGYRSERRRFKGGPSRNAQDTGLFLGTWV